MLDVIKEYLVSLGFQTDNTSFNQAQKSINNIDKAISSFASNSTKQFAVAGAAYASFLTAANVGIAKYMEGLAKADLENEKFAKRMWMNKDAAVAYKNTLSALGANLQDLYLSPELLQRYNQLRQQASGMAAPKEYSEQMKQIRDVTFEFQRLKLEATYAMQWVGYYLFKYLEGPIGNVKKTMKDLNDNLTKSMPQWTEKVAQVLSWIVRLGTAAVWGLGKVKDAFDSLTPATKVAGSAFLGFFALLKAGPIGWMIAGITALLLLMDDYKTYQEGGQSLFGSEWEKLDKFKQTLSDNGTFTDFKKNLDDISTTLGNILDDAGDIADIISRGLGFNDFVAMLGQGVQNTLDMLNSTLQGIAGALETIDGILSGNTNKMKTGLSNLIEGGNVTLFGPKTGGAINNTLEKGSTGDYSGMAEDAFALSFGWLLGDDLSRDLYTRIQDNLIKPFKEYEDEQKNNINPNYKKHADGGIQTTPHLGWVAEKYPESIIPLDPNKRQNSLNLLAQTAGILGAPVTNSTASTVNNYYYLTNTPKYTINGTDPTATAKAIDRTVDYGLLMRNLRGVY
jgi:hypothetical protein